MEVITQVCYSVSFIFFIFSTLTHFYSATDTISSGQSLTVSQTLISKGGNFEFGFFRLGNSLTFYLGTCYKKISVENKTYVWVANRNTPIVDPDFVQLRLVLEDGNLVLYKNSETTVWSTNLTSNAMNSSEAVLGDDGNFVMRNKDRPSDVYWQSFDHPTDTWLPGGKLGYDTRTKTSQVLTSWRSSNDPSKGAFSLELDPSRDQYLIKTNLTRTYWSSGSWNGQLFSNAPEMRLNYIYNYSYVKNEKESYFTYDVYNKSITSRFVMDLSGQIRMLTWNAVSQKWFLFWSQPRQQCEVYAYCGPFGVCDQSALPFCRCMEGFEPQSQKDWNLSDFSSNGCARRTALRCTGQAQDIFFLMSNVRLPSNDQPLRAANAEECKSVCLSNCSCSAYAYGSRCLIWNGELLSLEQLSHDDPKGSDLHLRLAASEIQGSKSKRAMAAVVGGVVSGVLVLGLIFGCIGMKKRNRKDVLSSTDERGKEDLELPLFDLKTVASATDKFSSKNQIGKGGFGPVYKGVLPTGEDIAIKRLSKDSRQGLQEFMNEVLLIAKLQHRNLVKLLGCCIEGEERMLIYEYMPNKSLDFFIFDKTRSVTLNWENRLNIIIGIARGLLYLHRDSRLRIIHRDLKASNVLLDIQMNPKISDFGMARTFGGEQTEDNTRRVVGTYGYMSPEYATDGLFSMKSDVFSFGVLVLEIISGKRNRLFHHADHDLNLLGHTWKLLNDKKALELLDASISDSFTASEVLKCIQVGLLCVQKFPADRPGMSSVVSMLESDGTMLPCPKQPGFYTERAPCEHSSSSAEDIAFSKNEVTCTLLEAR